MFGDRCYTFHRPFVDLLGAIRDCYELGRNWSAWRNLRCVGGDCHAVLSCQTDSALTASSPSNQMLQDSIDDWMMTLAKDPILADLHAKGLRHPNCLTETEARRFRWLMQARFAKAEVV